MWKRSNLTPNSSHKYYTNQSFYLKQNTQNQAAKPQSQHLPNPKGTQTRLIIGRMVSTNMGIFALCDTLQVHINEGKISDVFFVNTLSLLKY